MEELRKTGKIGKTCLMILLMLVLSGGLFSSARSSGLYSPQPDSIPPDPPSAASSISGPTLSCVGEISHYTTDTPIGCTCQWTVNGILQPSDSCLLEVTWTDAGLYVIGLAFSCTGGILTPEEFLEVIVNDVPEVYLGNDTTIYQGQSLLLDAGNPGCSYQWSTGDTTRTITVTTAGTYGVTAANNCGSDYDEITVSVIVKIPETGAGPEPRIYTLNGWLIIDTPAFPVNKMSVISVRGLIIYDGPYKEKTKLPGQGVYIVTLTASRGGFCRKVVR